MSTYVSMKDRSKAMQKICNLAMKLDSKNREYFFSNTLPFNETLGITENNHFDYIVFYCRYHSSQMVWPLFITYPDIIEMVINTKCFNEFAEVIVEKAINYTEM